MGLEEILIRNSEEDIPVDGGEFSSETAVCSADGIEMIGVKLNACRLCGSSMERGYFKGTSFTGCDLSNVRFCESTFREVVFTNCKLTGAVFSESVFDRAEFVNCSGKYTVFSACELKKSAFRECSMPEIGFGGAKFSAVKLSDNNFRQCDLVHAKMAGLDLSSCDIGGAVMIPAELKNVTVNYEQALTAAELLGIKIV